MTVAEKIKALRQERGLTMKELAEALGLKHASQVSNWENEANGPSKTAIVRLAEFFGKDTGFFLEGASTATKS